MVVQKNGELMSKAENLIYEAVRNGYLQGFQAGRRDAERREEDAYRDGHNAGMREMQEDDAYQRGLDDAWEAARKIVNESIFDIYSFSASDAIAKIREYEQEHAPGCDNCTHKDDQFSVCGGCVDGSEYETETIEANCGECHRRYYCEESPDSCTYAKKAQAEPEQNPERFNVQRTIWFDSNPTIKICSECGQDNGYDKRMKFCPNCGARVIEPQESEVNDADSD